MSTLKRRALREIQNEASILEVTVLLLPGFNLAISEYFIFRLNRKELQMCWKIINKCESHLIFLLAVK